MFFLSFKIWIIKISVAMAKALAAHRGAKAPFSPECQQDLSSVASCIPQPLLDQAAFTAAARRDAEVGLAQEALGRLFSEGRSVAAEAGAALWSAFVQHCERSVGSCPARHLTQPRPCLLCVKKAAADAPELSYNEHVPLP